MISDDSVTSPDAHGYSIPANHFCLPKQIFFKNIRMLLMISITHPRWWGRWRQRHADSQRVRDLVLLLDVSERTQADSSKYLMSYRKHWWLHCTAFLQEDLITQRIFFLDAAIRAHRLHLHCYPAPNLSQRKEPSSTSHRLPLLPIVEMSSTSPVMSPLFLQPPVLCFMESNPLKTDSSPWTEYVIAGDTNN